LDVDAATGTQTLMKNLVTFEFLEIAEAGRCAWRPAAILTAACVFLTAFSVLGWLCPEEDLCVSRVYAQSAPGIEKAATTLPAAVQQADAESDLDDPEALLLRYHYRCESTDFTVESMPVRTCLPEKPKNADTGGERTADENKTIAQRYEEAYRDFVLIQQQLYTRGASRSGQRKDNTSPDIDGRAP
jgi:hypothetical protein